MTKPNRRTKCQVEALEDRQLPAVTLTLMNNGATLSIKGDAQGEWINIDQNDDTDQLMVSYQRVADMPSGASLPISTFQSSTIKKIVVDLGAGDDVLNYTLDGRTMQWAKNISIDMGAGNDAAYLEFQGLMIMPLANAQEVLVGTDPVIYPQPQQADLLANLSIDVQGGAGDDVIQSSFGNIHQGLTYQASGGAGNDTLYIQETGSMSSSARVLFDQDGGAGDDKLWVDLGSQNLAAGAKVVVNQRGGAGSDHLLIGDSQTVLGLLSLNQSGGAGADTIETHAQMAWGSTGNVVAVVNGDAGNDQMLVHLKRDDIPPYIALFAPLQKMYIKALVNGGLGRNVSWVTPNVITILTQVKDRSWNIGQALPMD
jgi:hypothetical protein